MRVDLTGHTARVTGTGAAADAVRARLADSGARLVPEVSGPADLLVYCASATADLADAAAAMRAAAASGARRIVTVASAFGVVPMRGGAEAAASHAALLSLTRNLALDLAGEGVLVNAVAVLDGAPERTAPHTPVRRSATSADTAHAVLFLLAPESSYVTGHVLTVDGGWTAGYARDF